MKSLKVMADTERTPKAATGLGRHKTLETTGGMQGLGIRPGCAAFVRTRRRDLVKLIHTIADAAIAAAFPVPAHAADISGAGATFPFPICAKRADFYMTESGVCMNYQSIGSGGGIKQIK